MKKETGILSENVLDLSFNGLNQFGSMKTIHIGSAGIKNETDGNWITAHILGIIDVNDNGIEFCCSYIIEDKNNHDHYFRWNYDDVVEVIEALRRKYNFDKSL